MMTSFRPRNTQSGAALVVGLVLLVVLTLMAISSMNTASLDLIMAGNEQYRGRAFQASEAGIEQAIATGTFDTSADYSIAATSAGTGNDQYQFAITRPFGNDLKNPPPGNSTGAFSAIYFSIQSTGTSERNSRALNTQELYEVVKSDDGASYNKNACSGSASLYDAASSC